MSALFLPELERRPVKPLGLEGWAKQVPLAVKSCAVQHYRKE